MKTTRLWAALRLPCVLAAVPLWCATADMVAAQSLPILLQAEAMTLAAPMSAGYDMAAMGGRFIRPASGTSTTSPIQTAYAQVSLPASGTFYLWARIGGVSSANDALYVGINGSFDRVMPSALGPATYEWVRVETSNGSGVHGFALGAGNHTIQVGYGDIGTKLDALYLTANSAELPNFAAAAVPLLIEAKAFNYSAPMTLRTEAAALGEKYLSPTSGSSTTNPVESASVEVSVSAGTYYLWGRIAGATTASDALYLGIDASFDRIFPSAQGPYEWVRVETSNASGVHAFSLAAGYHTIRLGYGEIGSKLDAVYLTQDAGDVPTFAPMRRIIEAESMMLAEPMRAGTDASASGAQYVSPVSGSNTTVPVREAWATVIAPAAGSYHVWARVMAQSITGDALYIGFDNSWYRVSPSSVGFYEWVRVEPAARSMQGFSLTAGSHVIQVGHGQIGARLDALYVTDNPDDTPIASPFTPCARPSGGYEGFGRNTTGGEGQALYAVTNLDDTGPGSLRDALSQGNRCIAFNVAGTINLNAPLKALSNVTIDGFTAPSPGITLMNNVLPGVNADSDPPALTLNTVSNVVVRGIRIRKAPGDGITIVRSSNVVIDHVSVSGFGDGAVDVTESSRDVTIQWSVLGNGSTAHNFPSLISYETYRVSVLRNLYINSVNRSPHCSRGTQPKTVCDIRNNVMWNYTDKATEIRGEARGNVVNNYYYTPNNVDATHTIFVREGGSAHVSGNHSANGLNINALGNRSKPFAADVPGTITDAITAARAVRLGAGARGPKFGIDAFDEELIHGVWIPGDL